MKFNIVTALFLSSPNLYADAKAYFFKHEKPEEEAHGFGPEYFTCKIGIAMLPIR